MAGALVVLACLGRIGDIVLRKVGGYLVAPIQRQFKFLCCFNSNVTELQTQFKNLETTKEGVQRRVDEDLRDVRIIAPEVKNWLERANEVTVDEIEEIIKEKAKVKEGCLNGWCPNLKLRYSLSRKAVKKTKVIVDLQADEASYNKPSYNPLPACTRTIPNGDFMGFESRRLVMEEIIKSLKHGEINLIGVCGMGGVGKTTLVNEAAKRVKENNHFDEVAMVVVGQKPDLIDVQARISDMLGLKILRETKGPEARADLLRTRLLQDNKKVLIILDDVWEDFNLQSMGIPLEGANKNFKMLYTSRNRYLWHEHLRTKKEIPLELLSEEEAWQLFKEKVGDSADARDLQPIATQIVHECGRLPLALALIGGALSKKRAIKEIWEGMLDRLTCAPSTLVDKGLYSRLELSYEYLEDEEAKCLFLLCCLFKEDQNIRIEDLARYGLGLSIFDRTNEMGKARGRVLLIVDDLKSRHLLLDGEDKQEEFVKVHDVVRDMGISIASKIKFALVIHGEVCEWPKKDMYEHYTCISLISGKITELPKGLTCPNLEFLLLDCTELEELPCSFFEGMGKLKVLVLNNVEGTLALPSTLRNLHTLSLPYFDGKFDNASKFGRLINLKTLSFRYSPMEELPEAIGELVNLRLLDLTDTSLKRILPGVISRLIHLEELYVFRGEPMNWEGEDKKEGRYANLRELELLSKLNTLEIGIKDDVVIPEVPIFRNLKIYKVLIAGVDDSNVDDDDISDDETDEEIKFLYEKCKGSLVVKSSIPIPLNRGGIDSLLRSSDFLFLKGKGCNDMVQALELRDGVDDVLQQLKSLSIKKCDTPKCLANTTNQVHLPSAHAPAIFPILKVLNLQGLINLREICSSPVPARSFGDLTSILVHNCGRLRNLFQLPIVGCLTQLKRLIISSCDAMEEVIWKEQQKDVHVGTNNSIEFPKLEVLRLVKLPSLLGFCRGSDHIVFPQLKRLELQGLERFNHLFNYNMSSNSEQNHNVRFLSLFHQKVSLPNLEILEVNKLQNLERLVGHVPVSVGSFSKLKEFTVSGCERLLSVFPSQLLSMLRELERLTVESCKSMEIVFELEGLDSNESNPEILSPMKCVQLRNLPNLNCISKRDPMGFRYFHTLEIQDCNSLSYVFAPTKMKSIPELRELKISKCEMLSRIVAKENGLGENSVDEVEFPHLENLELINLPNLVSFFPNVNVNTTSLAKSTDHHHNPLQPLPLFNEKVSLPNLKVLEVTKLQNLERLGNGPLSVGLFSKLEEFSVNYCDKLLCVFPSQLLWMLRELKRLTIESCKSLEVVFEFEGLDSNEPNPEILFPLKFVELCYLPSLTFISKRDPVVFQYIQTLKIHNCNSLRYVFAPTLMKSIPQLRKLKISKCEKLSRIVAEENGLGESSVDEVEFPQLEQLLLLDLPNLLSFFPHLNVNTTTLAKSIDHLYNPVQPQPLFNKKVAFPGLEYLRIGGLQIVSDLWGSQLPTSSFSKLKTLYVRGFANLRSTFHPSIVRRLANLSELVIEDCSKMEGLVYLEEEIEDGGGRKVEKTLICPYRDLQLRSPPNLVSRFLNVNTTTLAKSIDHYYNPLRPHVVFNEKVAQLLYAKYSFDVLALGSNGNMMLWTWNWIGHWKVTPRFFPKQRQPASGLAMPNGVTGVNLEEAVPCMALSKDDLYIISACGGEVSLLDRRQRTYEVVTTFMPPPPASIFMAFCPKGDNIIAIGMEDSTICIFNVRVKKVIKSKLKGHKKRITGLAFSTSLNILVSSGADDQLCIWSTDTWEHLKSVPIQLPADKACNCDTRVQFHSDQIRMLLSHETQLAIYDASNMDRIRQWVPQDVLPAPISSAAYSCDSQLVYTSFCDGNIGVFDANSLTLTCLIAPSVYLSPALLSGGQAVYPTVIAANPRWSYIFAIGLTNGSIIIMYSKDEWGASPTVDNGMLNDRTASSYNTNQEEGQEKDNADEKVDFVVDVDEDEEDQEEKKKREEKGKGPLSR